MWQAPQVFLHKERTRALRHSTDDGMAQFAGPTEDLTRPPREGLCLDLRYNLPIYIYMYLKYKYL